MVSMGRGTLELCFFGMELWIDVKLEIVYSRFHGVILVFLRYSWSMNERLIYFHPGTTIDMMHSLFRCSILSLCQNDTKLFVVFSLVASSRNFNLFLIFLKCNHSISEVSICKASSHRPEGLKKRKSIPSLRDSECPECWVLNE